MSNENELLAEADDFASRMTGQPWACELIERLADALRTSIRPTISDEAVERAMAVFIASVREQDSQWTDEVDEGEQLLVSPDGDFFAMRFPMLKALTAAFSPPPTSVQKTHTSPEPAPSSPVPVAGMVLVPQAAIDWLMGAGPDPSGHWFGDFPDGVQPRGAFWWRNNFRAMLPAAPAHREVGE